MAFFSSQVSEKFMLLFFIDSWISSKCFSSNILPEKMIYNQIHIFGSVSSNILCSSYLRLFVIFLALMNCFKCWAWEKKFATRRFKVIFLKHRNVYIVEDMYFISLRGQSSFLSTNDPYKEPTHHFSSLLFKSRS